MTNQQLLDLFLKLLRADYEEQVIDILRAAGLWDNRSLWRLFGDNENNYQHDRQSAGEARGRGCREASQFC